MKCGPPPRHSAPAAGVSAAPTGLRRPSAGGGLAWVVESVSAFGRQHGATALLAAATTFILLLQLWRIALVDDEPVVVEEFLARLERAQRLDEDAPVDLVGFAVGLAGVVDPACRIAAVLRVDDVLVVDVEV